MNENEIIKRLKNIIEINNSFLDCTINENSNIYKDIQSLIDLYNTEKEKNLIFKGATIVTNLKNDGIEINMKADELVKLYLKEKEKNKELKSKIREKIKQYEAIRDEILKIENKTMIPSVTLDLKRNDYCMKILEELLEEGE